MSGYLPGLRCPECGDHVFHSTFSDTQAICADMGHWIGTEAECKKTDDNLAKFERWYKAQERRFRTGQMDTEEIAYEAWIEGRKRR